MSNKVLIGKYLCGECGNKETGLVYHFDGLTRETTHALFPNKLQAGYQRHF
jgi:hypothetical protein